MNGIKRLSLLLFLTVFICAGCSRSEVTGSPNSEGTESLNDGRNVEFSPDTPSGEDTPPPGEDTPPPGEDTPPPGEDTPPPGEDTPPPGEDTPPPGEDTPPPGEDTPPPVTKSGAGLFYTPEELEMWNNRRLNGPYKENWDNRIYAGAQLFMNGNKDGAPWVGYTGGGCWSPSTNKHPHDRGPRGMWANQAGFVYRVLKYAGDPSATAYFNKVKAYLLAHTTGPGINFKNSSKWCVSSYSIQGHQHWFGAWMRRLAITYSWLKADMSTGDKAKFEDWLLAAARYIVKHNEWHIRYSFSNRYNDQYNCDRQFCPGKLNRPEIYRGGPRHYQINDTWNNRGSVIASAVGIIGVLAGDSVLRDKGKRFFQESLRYSVWPDGTYADIQRDAPGATNAWSYPMDYMGSMSQVADVLARTGDNSLYEYTTRDGGTAGTGSGSGQPAKSIKQVIRHLAGQLDGTIIKRGAGGGKIINTTNTSDGGVNTSEYFFIQSNLYYKSDYIKTIYKRTAPGSPVVTRPEASGTDHHTGDWGSYPDVEFMWAGLEGKVWPYGSARGRTSGKYTAPLCDSNQRNCSADVGTR